MTFDDGAVYFLCDLQGFTMESLLGHVLLYLHSNFVQVIQLKHPINIYWHHASVLRYWLSVSFPICLLSCICICMYRLQNKRLGWKFYLLPQQKKKGRYWTEPRGRLSDPMSSISTCISRYFRNLLINQKKILPKTTAIIFDTAISNALVISPVELYLRRIVKRCLHHL